MPLGARASMMKPAMSVLSQVQVRRFTAGQAIFQEGDDAHNEAFLVQSGKVAIRKRVGGEERTLRVLGEGELLGEVSPRTRAWVLAGGERLSTPIFAAALNCAGIAAETEIGRAHV